MRSSTPARRRWSSALVAWAIRLLYLYPAAWRERYADEVAAVLDDYPVTLWTLCDLLVGALDVRLRGDLLPRRLISMTQRIRTSEVAIFAAFVLYCMAWLSLRYPRERPRVYDHTYLAHPEIGAAYSMLNLAGYVVVPIIVFGALPLLVAAFRQAIARHQWGIVSLLVVPILAALLAIGLVGFLTASWRFQWQNLDVVAWVWSALADVSIPGLFLGLLVVLSLGVCAIIAISGIQRSHVGLPLARFTMIPATLAALAIVVGGIGGLWAFVIVNIVAQQLGAPIPYAAAPALMMVAALALAIAGLWQGVGAVITTASVAASA